MKSAESERGRGLSKGGSTLGVNSRVKFTRRQQEADQSHSPLYYRMYINVKAISVDVAVVGLISIEAFQLRDVAKPES